jgi:hypothetical protein
MAAQPPAPPNPTMATSVSKCHSSIPARARGVTEGVFGFVFIFESPVGVRSIDEPREGRHSRAECDMIS